MQIDEIINIEQSFSNFGEIPFFPVNHNSLKSESNSYNATISLKVVPCL